MGNLIVRLHLRLRVMVVVFFGLCLVLLWFVRVNSCRSYIETWAGAPFLVPWHPHAHPAARQERSPSVQCHDAPGPAAAGMLPVLLVITGASVAWSYFYMPANPSEKTPILGVRHAPPARLCSIPLSAEA